MTSEPGSCCSPRSLRCATAATICQYTTGAAGRAPRQLPLRESEGPRSRMSAIPLVADSYDAFGSGGHPAALVGLSGKKLAMHFCESFHMLYFTKLLGPLYAPPSW